MNAALRKRILDNRFAPHLLEFQVDQQAFTELCGALRELAHAWHGQALIDKQVVFCLCETLSIVRNKLHEYRQRDRRSEADALEDLFIELDRLIMEECFDAGR